MHILIFVDAQGLDRHPSSIVSAFPNITESTSSNGVLLHCSDLFTGYSVRNGDEFATATQLPKPPGDEGIKGAVPQNLYCVSMIYTVTLAHIWQTLSKTSNSALTPSVCVSGFKPRCLYI